MLIPKTEYPILTPATALRLGLVGLFDVGLVWLIVQLVQDGSYPLAAVVIALGLVVTVSMSLDRFRAYRWLCVGLSQALLFVLYPILYTFYISTTNTGGGHVLTRQQVIETLEREQYVPEGGQEFGWTAFESPAGEYALWLQAEDGAALWVTIGATQEGVQPGAGTFGPADEDGIPLEVEG